MATIWPDTMDCKMQPNSRGEKKKKERCPCIYLYQYEMHKHEEYSSKCYQQSFLSSELLYNFTFFFVFFCILGTSLYGKDVAHFQK